MLCLQNKELLQELLELLKELFISLLQHQVKTGVSNINNLADIGSLAKAIICTFYPF